MTIRTLPLYVLMTLALLLSGCAKSPQQVMLDPSINASAQLKKRPVVQLSIVDNRPSPILGTRGGVYATNHITLAEPLERSLRPEMERALQAIGAELNQVSPFPIRLTLYLDRLSYEVEDTGTLPLMVNLHSTLRAQAKSGQLKYEGRWESSRQHQFLSVPTEAKNQDIINDLLSETLNRMINDPKLLQFLQQ
ncbi:YajG family lipoprotein [Motiliproteus sp. SC1-56]|uniref:YajG family lipoprotein n=1 Tax=Motiliproteus sp. SC1-56 TaxID=2799565 RepID=UPI001A8DEE0C|nr:YajG family lipoprotein [Motiliproteus sp. SC1-56]